MRPPSFLRSVLVVFAGPGSDDDPCLMQADEPVLVQALVA